MNRLKTLVAGGAAVAIGIAAPLTPGTASAGTGIWVFSTDSAPTGGVAIFDGNYGGGTGTQEKLAVCDQDVDGHIAWGRIRIEGTWRPWYSDTSEASPSGSCTEDILDVTDGLSIDMQICLRNKWNNVFEYCSTDTAIA